MTSMSMPAIWSIHSRHIGNRCVQWMYLVYWGFSLPLDNHCSRSEGLQHSSGTMGFGQADHASETSPSAGLWPSPYCTQQGEYLDTEVLTCRRPDNNPSGGIAYILLQPGHCDKPDYAAACRSEHQKGLLLYRDAAP